MEDFNHFGEAAKAFDIAISQVVRKTAFDLQGNMQKQIRVNGQIDTGFMINSVYVVTNDSSTYAEKLEEITRPSDKPTKSGKPRKLSKAKQAIKDKMHTLLPEIAADPGDNKTAWVAVGAPYGFFQNYGTRYQPARPFLEPAVERTRPSFDKAMSRIEDKMKELM